jgi:predicted ATP-grasp superfamily ATP-dependent carboligase
MNSHAGCTAAPPTIAVVGFSARAAAQSAKRQGFEVVAVDLCADRDLLVECRAHYRLDDLNWPDLLNSDYPNATLLLTGGMEHRSTWVERCHSQFVRAGATGTQLRSMRNLANWEKWAASSELGWPRTISAENLVSISIDSMRSSKWLIKNLESGGGTGTTDFEGQGLPQNLDRIYLQQRMLGETIGVTFLSSQVSSTFIGAMATWPPESNAIEKRYLYRGSYGPIPLSKTNIDKLQRFAAVAGRESGLLGVWQADFLLHEGELTLLEINPRWSASMDLLDITLEMRLVEKHDASVRGMMTSSAMEQLASRAWEESLSSPERMLGKLIVYADQSCIISSAQSEFWWSKRWNMDLLCELNRCRFADIPTVGTSIPAGGPILSVMATGSASESILLALESAGSEVRSSSVSCHV